jgi:hypothetical protein
MKFKLIACIGVALVWLIAGCQKGFLHFSLLEESAKEQPAKESGLEQAISHVYSFLGTPSLNRTFADVAAGDANFNGPDTFSVQAYASYAEKKNMAYFEGIRRVNEAIETIKDATADDEDLREQLIAEMRFLRGHFHFELKKILNSAPDVEGAAREKAYHLMFANAFKVDRPWAEIEADFKAGTSLLPAALAGQQGRPNRFTAWAYLCKVYIFQKKWAQAISAADEVINKGSYHLNPEFSEAFNPENKKNQEVVFAIPYVDDEQDPQTTGAKHTNLVASRNLMNYYKTDDMGLPMRNNDEITAADLLDPRLDYTIFKQGVSQNWYNYVIRYADVLLWKAEAAIELADFETGRQLINQVRRRVRDGKKTQKSSSDAVASYKIGGYATLFDCYECAIEALKDERRLELALEGHRFFDLVRWADAKQ